jgi:acyl-CoA thioesterase
MSADHSEPPNQDIHHRHLPYLELLGIEIKSAADGQAECEMTVREEHLRTLDIGHGGAIASLMDTALGVAARTSAPDAHYVVTIQLNLNYVRPVKKGDVMRGTGTVQHAGRQTAVARGEIRTADDTLIATGSATFVYLPLP